MSNNLLTQTLSDVIQKGTAHELSEAFALAKVLSNVRGTMDSMSFEFSTDLFVAVTLCTAHEVEEATFFDVLNYLLDPGWDSEMQVLCSFQYKDKLPLHKDAARWLKGFTVKALRLDSQRAESLVRLCHAHWKKALKSTTEILLVDGVVNDVRPVRSIQVFNPEKVEYAMEQLSKLSAEKRAGGEGVLCDMKVNGGYRSIPDAKMAAGKLESAKCSFENLSVPLERLQLDLILSGEMEADEFYVMPILLLGDPGIGKTFLAMQLAEALGVDLEKMGASGAQGAFQLNGSHPSWNNGKYGSLVERLAKGKTSSPVVLIDEVDKIGNSSNYPILPALLDLLEPRTAKCFKDEFLGIEFDCSRMIFILTANSIESVPTPLLSRVNVFDVPRPGVEQRLRIILQAAKQWQLKTKRVEIEFDIDACQELAERVDLDLRKTTDIVREAFGIAIRSGAKTAKLLVPAFNGRCAVGFGRTEHSQFLKSH